MDQYYLISYIVTVSIGVADRSSFSSTVTNKSPVEWLIDKIESQKRLAIYTLINWTKISVNEYNTLKKLEGEGRI